MSQDWKSSPRETDRNLKTQRDAMHMQGKANAILAQKSRRGLAVAKNRLAAIAAVTVTVSVGHGKIIITGTNREIEPNVRAIIKGFVRPYIDPNTIDISLGLPKTKHTSALHVLRLSKQIVGSVCEHKQLHPITPEPLKPDRMAAVQSAIKTRQKENARLVALSEDEIIAELNSWDDTAGVQDRLAKLLGW